MACTPRAVFVDGAGVRLQVYDYGNPGAPPLILVHGIQDFALSLGAVAEGLCDAYHVVSYDLRGHGESGKPGLYSMSHHMADLGALLTKLELDSPVLFGHSLGGQIAANFAGIFSEVPSALVSVEGLGPPMRDVDAAPETRRRRARRAVESLLRPTGALRPMRDVEMAVRLFRSNHSRLAESDARRLVALGTEAHPDGGVSWKWDSRVQTTWLSTTPGLTEERWGWIECPVLVVTGGVSAEFWSRRRGVAIEEATMSETELRRRLALFRDCTHVDIPEAGHMVHYDAPARLVESARTFLAARGLLPEPGGCG